MAGEQERELRAHMAQIATKHDETCERERDHHRIDMCLCDEAVRWTDLRDQRHAAGAWSARNVRD